MATATNDVAMGGDAATSQGASLAYPAAERLETIDRNNARPLDRVKSACAGIAAWFVNFCGTMVNAAGDNVTKTLHSFSWITNLKGHFPRKVTSLFSYAWVKGEDDKMAPEGKPLAYRLWSLFPSFDLSNEADLAAFNETGILKFSVRPVSNIIGLKRTAAKLFEKDGRIKTYDVPRIFDRNFVIVNVETDADGNLSIKDVLANYYMRLMFRNKDWKVEGRDSQLFSSCYLRKAVDVTAEFVKVFDTVDGKDFDSRVHATLTMFLGANPELKDSKLARIMAIQAHALAGAHVAALPGGEGTIKRENNLVDRVCLNTTTIRGAYFGVERTIEGKAPEDEFLDFHCRLVSIEDPITQRARGLEGVKRFNNALNINVSDL